MATMIDAGPETEERRLREFEEHLKSRPPRPGHFRCEVCRWQHPHEDEHCLYRGLCFGCGVDRLEALVLEIRGPATEADRLRAIRLIEELAAAMPRKKAV